MTPPASPADHAKVIILGSGTPIPDPASSGPSVAADINVRTEGAENLSKQGLTVNVHEISAAGPVYRDANVTIQAISVRHGSWPLAFGYAIDAAGRSIVISGDTAPSEAIVEACQGGDVLVHEVYSA